MHRCVSLERHFPRFSEFYLKWKSTGYKLYHIHICYIIYIYIYTIIIIIIIKIKTWYVQVISNEYKVTPYSGTYSENALSVMSGNKTFNNSFFTYEFGSPNPKVTFTNLLALSTFYDTDPPNLFVVDAFEFICMARMFFFCSFF